MDFNHYQNGIHHDYRRCVTTFERPISITRTKQEIAVIKKNHLECVERGSGNGCEVRITLDQDEVFLNQPDQHNHPPNPEITAVKKISSCYRKIASAIWETFSEFLIFCNLFHE